MTMIVRVVGFICALALVPRPARAEFERRNLAVPGNVLWVTTGDVNGDGRSDLVVSFRRRSGPAAERFIGVFVRRAQGLPIRPDLRLAVPSNAAAFDLGDADGDGDDDLIFLMASGAFYQSLGTSEAGRVGANPLARLVSTPTLVVVPEEEDLVTWDFLRFLAPGSEATLVLPGRRSLRMYRRSKGAEWADWCDVRLQQWSYYDAESTHYRPSGRGGSSGRPYAFRVTTIVPNLDFVDQTGDGKFDLVTHYEDRVSVHASDGEDDGCFSSEPIHRQWFKVRSRSELESRDNRVSAQVRDLDADGVADFVVSKIGGGITSLKTEVRLYRGIRGGGFEASPAQVFRDGGFASLARFIDVDGDGALEMVHPHAEVSIMGMTRAMLSSTVGIDVRIRRRDPEGIRFFERKPIQTLDLSLGLDLSSGAALRGSAPLFGHDFDGDGRRDVIVPDGAEHMVLYRGLAAEKKKGGRPFEDDARIKLSAPGSNATEVISAGPGQPPEVLVYYPNRKAMSGRLVLFRRK